jgi:hypothetical protein
VVATIDTYNAVGTTLAENGTTGSISMTSPCLPPGYCPHRGLDPQIRERMHRVCTANRAKSIVRIAE